MTAAVPPFPTSDAMTAFLLGLSLLLLVAVTLGRLAVRAGMPPIVGEFTTGILLGPSVLGQLAPGVTGWLFPADPARFHLLDAVGQLGVLLLVGLTGAHLDIGLIRRQGATAVRVSLFGLVVPLALGFAVGWILPESLTGPAGRELVAPFLGVALSLSAIPVIARTLADLGMLHRTVGQLTLAAGMIDDTVGWVLLSVLSGMALNGDPGVTLLGTVGAVGLVLVVAVGAGRPLTRAVVGAANRSPQAAAVPASVVVLLLAAAAGTSALGLEGIFGAFICGILISRYGRPDPAQLGALRSVVNGVLAPIFFATVGLRMDLTALADLRLLGVALLVLTVAIVGKFLGAYLGAAASRLGGWEALALGAGMNARGVVGVVVAMVGLRLGILTPELFTVVVLVAAVTSVMAPPVLRVAMSRINHTDEEHDRRRRAESQFLTPGARSTPTHAGSPMSSTRSESGMKPETDVDVVVVGGGPGGSTVSTLVAMQGHRVLLLEKEQFPRYQIGESLLPSTVHGIGKLLGVTEALEQARFMPKRGGTFRWGSKPEPWTFSFSVSDAFSGPTSMAYQVERMKFDQILLDNARAKGVDVRERCSVVDVLEEGDRVVGVRYQDADGVRREVSARFVVDASGNTSRIQSRIGGRRHYSDFFRNLALFGYFTGGRRLPAPNSGNILCVAFQDGWFWYIPLTDELTSVGAVLRPEAVKAAAQSDRAQALHDLIQQCPLIADYLSDATRVTEGPYGEVRIRKDYSYSQDVFHRPGMVLVGDAACFIDPVFSSGVHLATYSGLLAARSINTVLAGELDEKVCFEEYEARYRREYTVFHDFLLAFYDMHQDEDSYFWTAKKIISGTAEQLESFVELVGGGASRERGLLDAGSYVERRGEFDEFADLIDNPDDATDNDRKLFESSLVETVLEEGAKLQVQAAAGESLDEDPVREGGLVPTADGLRWTTLG